MQVKEDGSDQLKLVMQNKRRLCEQINLSYFPQIFNKEIGEGGWVQE